MKFGKRGKRFLILCAIAVIILIVILLRVFTAKSTTIGNTIGNIRNYGYIAGEKNWIYYVAPNQDANKVCIYKSTLNNSEKETLLEAEYDISSINFLNDYLYFITIEAKKADDLSVAEDDIDNKICKMKSDGTEFQILNDNEFSNECYAIYVVNDKVFYVGIDNNIYNMDLDGNNKTRIYENKNGYLGISEKYIIYNDFINSENTTDYITYIMNLDGTDSRPVNNERLYNVCIKGDYIYYTDRNKNICKVKVDGSNKQTILETTAYNLNLSGKYLYYMNYKSDSDEKVCIFRVNLNGKNNKIIKELSTYSSFIDIINDRVYYADSDDTKSTISLINSNNLKENELFSFNFSDSVKEENNDVN